MVSTGNGRNFVCALRKIRVLVPMLKPVSGYIESLRYCRHTVTLWLSDVFFPLDNRRLADANDLRNSTLRHPKARAPCLNSIADFFPDHAVNRGMRNLV